MDLTRLVFLYRPYPYVRFVVNDHGLFIADWFGVREKHCSRLEIYDCLRASEQADGSSDLKFSVAPCGDENDRGFGCS